MKNFISHNIKYLCAKYFLNQDEFGGRVGLNKGVIGTYVRGKTNPQVETIQRICKEFEISIDDFINKKLESADSTMRLHNEQNSLREPQKNYGSQRDSVASMIASEVARQLEPATNQINEIHEAMMILELQEGIANLKKLILEKKKEQEKKTTSK